jgi:hypothetical protein
VAAAVRDEGFTAAVAIFAHPGARFGDLYRIPRMILRPQDSPFETWLKARGLYPAWSRLPRLGLLRSLRRSGR